MTPVDSTLRGTYILDIHLSKNISLRPGRLGPIHLGPGDYLYVGSAMNSLVPRLLRHARRFKKTFHWHIDYLLEKAALEGFSFLAAREKVECELAAFILNSLGEGSASVKGFGSSDCACLAHLFKVPGFGRLSPDLEKGRAGTRSFTKHSRRLLERFIKSRSSTEDEAAIAAAGKSCLYRRIASGKLPSEFALLKNGLKISGFEAVDLESAAFKAAADRGARRKLTSRRKGNSK
jgi:Uri superfamily endonuclease